MVVAAVVVVRLQDRATQQSARARQGTAGPSGRGRDASCMTLIGVATSLPAEARAAGLIVALSTPLGCAEYIERSCDSVNERATNGSAKRRVLI